MFVFGCVGDAGECECLASLLTGAALAAVLVAALVATPGLGIINTEKFATACYIRLCPIGIRGEQFYSVICTFAHCSGECIDERRPAIGVDSMVTAVVSHEYAAQVTVFRHAGSYGEHDTVAKRYNGGSHVFIVVLALGYIRCTGEERGVEILLDEPKGDNNMLYTQPLAMICCERIPPDNMIMLSFIGLSQFFTHSG